MIVEHYGVKGMKWGVRKADKAYANKRSGQSAYIAVHNAAADIMNQVEIPKFNAKHKAAGLDWTKDSPQRDAAIKEYESIFLGHVKEQAKGLPTNASGTKQWGVKTLPNGDWGMVLKEVKHADDDADEVISVVRMSYNDDGSPKNLTVLDAGVEHTAMAGQEFIEHYGVKGMRWGVRKKASSRSGGGERKTAKATIKRASSEDYKTARATKRKPLRALSNQELKEYNERMNLESNYNRLNPSTMERGRQRIEFALKLAGTAASVYKVYNSPEGQAAIKAGKTMLKKLG